MGKTMLEVEAREVGSPDDHESTCLCLHFQELVV